MTGHSIKNDELFDNRLFWDRRYRENPTLGSGIGSRGDNLLHKRLAIAAFLSESQPRSILDVGCGDFEVLSGLNFDAHYRGLDISPIVVQDNSRKFAKVPFECVDFASLSDVLAYESDSVICCEVLIHQHRYGDYVRLLDNIVRATKRSGFVSGYVSNPRPSVTSDIIAWHEPITATLTKLGARNVQIRAYSLEADCLCFVSFDR